MATIGATTTMTAVVRDTYGEADDVLRVADDVPVPTPGPGEVLVEVDAAGVDQGVWHLMTGLPYLTRLFGFGLRRPKLRVLGHDLAGRVEAVGADVTAFRPGDDVLGTGDGTYAPYTVTTPDRLAPKPASVGFEAAAAVPTSGLSALQGLRRLGGIRAGQRVLVLGASGGVGSFAVQLAKRTFGAAHVTGVCSTAKVDFVRDLGADDVIDYTRADPLAGDRYDLVLDAGGNRPLRALRRALTDDGTLVIVGSEETHGRWLQGTDKLLRAMVLSPFVGPSLRPLMSGDDADDLRFLIDQVASGVVVPAVDRTYPLADVADAIRDLRERRVRGKAVIGVSTDPRRAKLDP